MKSFSHFRSVLIKLVATLGGIGYIPRAPGTYGSLVGLLIPIFIAPYVSSLAYCLLIALGIVFSIWCCGAAEKLMQEKDPSAVILDECIAMPLCFLGLSIPRASVGWWILGFILFRFFDILKPLGIKKLQALPGGWGIVVDDLAAAVWVNVCLRILLALFDL
jgi:phosphatidylglycerophosphatase A